MRHAIAVSSLAALLFVTSSGCDQARTAPSEGIQLTEADSCIVTTKPFPAHPADFSARILDMRVVSGWTPGGFYEYVHDLSTTTSVDTIPFADVHVSMATNVFLHHEDGTNTPISACALQLTDSLLIWRADSYALPSPDDPRPGFHAISALIFRSGAR